MDSVVTEDQRSLLDASMRFMQQAYPLTSVRDSGYLDGQIAADYRRQAGELGWFSMLVPEGLGGGSVTGNGVLDAALIAFRRGGLLQPGAFVPTNVVAYALSVAGSEEQQAKVLPSLISGEATAAWALGAPTVHGSSGARATAAGEGYTLSGSATFVQDADVAEWLLVTAATDDGLVQFLLPGDSPGVSIRPMECLDLSRRFAEVRFDGAEGAVSASVGREVDAADLVAQQLAIACVLNTAECVGAMDHDFEMALQYSKDRIAFGRPIGSFQAIKHVLADTSLALEMSKAITLAAARTVGSGDSYGPEAASMAKAFVGDAAIELAQDCFQIFGGIGYTWEHD
ncbi:MAG: hypothetical protein QOH68_2850, partial [Nocardioidaceae bacterium]|nr:hypothetical protein [Nocardioidaceae bacterium]